MDFRLTAAKYPITFEKCTEANGGEGYYAYSPYFPGILGDGLTYEDAANDLLDVLEDVIEQRSERGEALPEIQTGKEYSGVFTLRIGKNLHALLAKQAEADGKSISDCARTYIAYGLGYASTAQSHNLGR